MMRHTKIVVGFVSAAGIAIATAAFRHEAPGAGSDIARIASHCPQRPAPAVRFGPVDLKTDLGVAIAPELRIDYGGERVDEAVLASLAANTELITWPNAEIIPTTITVVNVPLVAARMDQPEKGASTARSSEPIDSEAHVRLAPTTPLARGWYALRTRLPRGMEFARHLAGQLDAQERFLSRFHVGSNPILTSIEACDKGTERRSIILGYSEPVVASPGQSSGAPLIARQDGRPTSCDVIAVGRGSVTAHTAICNVIAGDERVRIDVGGFVAAGDRTRGLGLPPNAQFTEGRALDIDLSAARSTDEHCRLVRL